MLSCTEQFRRFDLFKFEGRPKFIGGPQSSRFGFVGTLILLTIVLFYIGLSTFQFFTNPPATSVTQSPTQNQRHPIVLTCFRVPNITDHRYFGFTIQSVTLDASGKKNSTDLRVYTPSNKSKDTVCIDPADENAYLRSFCNPGDCAFIKAKFWVCGSDDSKNPAHPGDPASCAPYIDLVNALQYNYIEVVYKTVLGEIILHTAPKINASAVYQSVFSLNETIRNPDLIRWFQTDRSYSLVHDRDTYAIQYFFGMEYPKKEVLEVSISMGAFAIQTVENRITSLDLLGKWSAFANLMVAVLALMFMKYNENKFYEKNPYWEKLDEHFEVERGSDATVADETSRLIARKQKVAKDTNNSLGAGVVPNASSPYSKENSMSPLGDGNTYGDLA